MLSIGKLAPGPRAASYFLDRRAGCALEYYTGRGEAAGRWIGRGAQALALHGALDSPEREDVLRRLLAGHSPSGQELVKPVLRGDPRGRVAAAVVVHRLREAAESRDLDVPQLLQRQGPNVAPESGGAEASRGAMQMVRAWERCTAELERARRRPRWPAPTLAAEMAERMLRAAGLDPTGALVQRTPTGRVRDVLARALRHREDRVDVRVPGLDLTFSAPKSVSVLWALADDTLPATSRATRTVTDGGADADRTRVGEQVRDAHRVAVAEALAYLELTCTDASRGHHRGDDKDRHVSTDGLIGVAFEHRTSRCGDPQLHSHVVVANMLHGADGKWSALDTREVFAQARTAGFVYQAVLRGELTRRLGVSWGPVRNGQAEIAGMPGGLLRVFSKRRQQIEQRLEQIGLDTQAAAQAATLDTRPAKANAGESPVRLQDRWNAEAESAGFGRGVVQGLTHRVLHQPATTALVIAARETAAAAGPIADELTEALLAPSGLTNKRATFLRRDVLRGVCEQLPAGLPIRLTGLRALATRVVRDARVVPLLGDAPVQSRPYSTRELLTVESHALELATQRTANGATAVHAEATSTLPLVSSQPDRSLGVVSPALLAAAQQDAQRRGCSPEQQQMVQRLLTSGAGVEVVVGAAGSGKTTALAIAAQTWQRAGVTVHGAALAAIAARVLQDSAGIPSRSLQRLLNQLDPAPQVGAPPPGQLLPPGSVLIVDEAGMVGTRTLHQLLSLSVQQRFKLVLVGDPQQLPEIEAGGLFATLAARLPSVDLLGNQRQQQAWEQRALRELRTGDPMRAVGAYARRGRLHVTDTLDELTDRLLTDYERQLTEHDPEQVLVIASSRGDARRLNAQIRQRLLAHGHLGEDELRIELPERDGQSMRGERRYRQGDQVLVTVNDYPYGLLNGTRGTVTALHPRACAVTVRLEDGRTLRLEQDYLKRGHLVHGYALTAHKAQGVTVDVAMLWGTQALTRETGYVALSRGRQANHLYSTWDLLQRDLGPAEQQDLDRPRAGLGRPDPATQRRLAQAALVQRLEATGRQRTARSWWRRNTKSQPGGRSAERAS